MNKKIFAILCCVALLAVCVVALVACECDHEFVDGVCTKCGAVNPDYDMTAIKFENKTVTYNGKAQTITVTGTLPQGLTVSYTYYSDEAHTAKVDEAVNVGTYYAVASFACDEDHNKPADMNATLTITKATHDMSGVKLENKTVVYNGENQKLTITGTLPAGVEVVYEYYSDAEYTAKVTDTANVGTYYVKAVYSTDGNYEAIAEAKATLTVTKAAFATVDFVVTGTNNEDKYDARFEGEGVYYLEYAPNTTYVLSVSSATADGNDKFVPEVKWFTDNDLSHEVNPLDDPSLTDIGDTLYVQVRFVDENHEERTIVRTIVLQKKTFEIKTYEDLLMMRDHIYGNTEKEIDMIAAVDRGNVRYILLNDIDCQGRIWTPVSYMMEDGNDYATRTFCSEFDGKGHTISNYKITEESFDAEALNTAAVKILYVGFFGRVNNGIMYGGTVKNDAELDAEACNIHDVTFSNVSVKLDAKSDNYQFGTDVAVYAGFVAGYLDGGNWHTIGRTNLYNITVKNSEMDIDAYKTHAGGIIGYEDIAIAYPGLRKNLTVENCSIYAISSQGTASTNVYIGGLIGRWKGTMSETPDAGSTWWTRYNDCVVKDIKLGYHSEAWSAAETDEEKAQYLHVSEGNIYVGAFIGSLESMNITFKNCTVENYLIAHTSPSDFYTGLTGKFQGSLFCLNTTATEGDWNDGVHGVYGVPSEGVVSKQERESVHKWGSYGCENEVNTELMDQKEQATESFLGL